MFDFKCLVNNKIIIHFESETLSILKFLVVIIFMLCISNCIGDIKSDASLLKRNLVSDKSPQFVESNLEIKQIDTFYTNSKDVNEKQADENSLRTVEQIAKTRKLYGPPRDYTYFLDDYESFGDELTDNRVRRNPENNKEYSKQKEDINYEEIAYDEDDDDYADEDSDCSTKPACTTTTECTTPTECTTTPQCTTTSQCTCTTTPECTTTECGPGHNKKSKQENKKSNGNRNKAKNKNWLKWSQWSDWSPCSASCGEGHMTRWRGCAGPNCADGEKEAQFKPCNNPECE